MSEVYEYQYSLYNQRVDAFFELEGMGMPNMFLLRSHKPVTKHVFQEYCEHLRDDTAPFDSLYMPKEIRLQKLQEYYKLSIVSMGAAW